MGKLAQESFWRVGLVRVSWTVRPRADPYSPFAVMGPSGAGKSTFLDAICQRTPPGRSQGRVTINNSTEFSTRELFSFVEQDDALLGVLTVKETVTFAAHLA